MAAGVSERENSAVGCCFFFFFLLRCTASKTVRALCSSLNCAGELCVLKKPAEGRGNDGIKERKGGFFFPLSFSF